MSELSGEKGKRKGKRKKTQTNYILIRGRFEQRSEAAPYSKAVQRPQRGAPFRFAEQRGQIAPKGGTLT
jgi:hypothetical protein